MIAWWVGLCRSTGPLVSGSHSCTPGVEQWCQAEQLAAGECPLVLADHYRVETPVRVGQHRQQGSGLWPVLP